MTKDTSQPDPTPATPETYEFRIEGHLPPAWADVFEGMRLTLMPGGDTLISGPVVDQAALHGLLACIRDYNLTLIAVRHIQACSPARKGVRNSRG